MCLFQVRGICTKSTTLRPVNNLNGLDQFIHLTDLPTDPIWFTFKPCVLAYTSNCVVSFIWLSLLKWSTCTKMQIILLIVINDLNCNHGPESTRETLFFQTAQFKPDTMSNAGLNLTNNPVMDDRGVLLCFGGCHASPARPRRAARPARDHLP